MKHSTAVEQATGEAVYVDDLPSFVNELHAAVVLSSKAKANILSIDATEALAMSGVHRFLTEKDLPGHSLKSCNKESNTFFLGFFVDNTTSCMERS